MSDAPENHPKSADRNDPDAIDQRLATVAEAVGRGQLIERHWEFFRATHFPEMNEREAADALFAWAERNGIRATLHPSLADADEASPRATHVRLSPKNYWGPPFAKSEPQEAGTLSASCTVPLGEYAYDDTYMGTADHVEEGERLARVVGGKQVLFMKNHGVLVTGDTVAQAYRRLYKLERVCRAQVLAMSTGRPLEVLSDEIVAQVQAPAENDRHSSAERERLFFEAMMRILDRELPGYAD